MPPASKRAPLRRRDAEDNRARIIAAAREVFAASGFDVSLSAIAARSGVGRATLYRNFPDRFALAAAIFEDNLLVLEALASEQGDRPEAFMILLSAMVEQQVEAHAMFPALLAGPSTPDLEALVRRTKRLLRKPLRAAKDAELVRGDLGLSDVIAVLTMISAVVMGDASLASRRQRARRALELLSQGLVVRARD
ncbi:MAG: helix-turn-helix domain-containing protein [Enhygromyxa sp.]